MKYLIILSITLIFSCCSGRKVIRGGESETCFQQTLRNSCNEGFDYVGMRYDPIVKQLMQLCCLP